VFPGSGCPVPESPAGGTASAVSKRVPQGLRRVSQLRWSRELSELRLSTHRSGHGWWVQYGWLVQYAITVKVTSPRALDRSIW
jgi:hypothetical protein